MPRRSTYAKRPAEWALRVALAVLVALIGYGGITFSLAQVVAKGDPALAHRLAPYDGRITARLASSLAGAGASDADRVRADDLARHALRQDPTAIAAVSTLGIDAQVRGDPAAARRLFAYAQTLSRRDLTTQFWAIEDAVGRGDIPGALRQYDIALRIEPTISDTLFPVLAAAATEQRIRASLLRKLAERPPWGERYLTYVAASGRDPQAVATLLTGLRRAGVAVPKGAQADAVNALLTSGALDRAWLYYATIRRGADRRRSRDPRFADVEAPSQLDWTTVSEGSISATIRDGAVDYSGPASVGGPLLRQTQLLPPGDYRLTGHSEGIDQVRDARPYWVLTCQDAREIGRIVILNSDQGEGNFAGLLRVPSGCPLQTLVLVARPSDAASGISGKIDRAVLAPVR